MKEAKVSGVQLLKPGEDPAVMLYLVDEAFDHMTLPPHFDRCDLPSQGQYLSRPAIVHRVGCYRVVCG